MFIAPIFIVKSYAHWLATSSFVIQVFPTETIESISVPQTRTYKKNKLNTPNLDLYTMLFTNLINPNYQKIVTRRFSLFKLIINK